MFEPDMIYREAISADAASVAALHAKSWRVAYRGILRDEFLDGDVVQNRVEVWEKRLTAPTGVRSKHPRTAIL